MEKFLYERLKNKTPKINAWFAFPAIESFGMASLGFLSIFKQIDLMEDVFVERIFSDTKATAANLEELDVIGFSNSFEIDILTILKMFSKYKIPPLSKDRNENYPLIFAGGPVITANPLPYQDFYDFVSIGDARVVFEKIFQVLVEKRNESKEAKLQALSEIEGVWVPKYGTKKPVKKITDTLEEPLYTPILSEKSYFKDTFIIEIERGCPKTCNFCIASWLNLPVRYTPLKKIIEAIDFGLQHTDKIALLGAYVAGHPDFDKILEYIREKNKINPVELTLSSLRADLTGENVIRTLVECGQRSATIAVEAGSERLRKVINKDLTDEQILKTIENARIYGLKGLKIYAMIGLPTETDEDIEALINLMKRIKAANKGFELTLSVSSFIPKAQTPFQWSKKADSKELDVKLTHLKNEISKLGITMRPTSVDWDLIQSILSRTGISLSSYLLKVVENGGNLGAFKQTWRKMAKEGLLPELNSYAAQPIPENPDEPLPWDFICVTDKQILKKRQKDALKSR